MEAFLFPMEERWVSGYQPPGFPHVPCEGIPDIKPKLSFLLLPSPSNFGSSLLTLLLLLLFFSALLGTMSAFAASWTRHPPTPTPPHVGHISDACSQHHFSSDFSASKAGTVGGSCFAGKGSALLVFPSASPRSSCHTLSSVNHLCQ